MAPVIPNPDKIRAFETESEFEAWMARNHDQETEIWIQYYKKASGRRTIVGVLGTKLKFELDCVAYAKATRQEAERIG